MMIPHGRFCLYVDGVPVSSRDIGGELTTRSVKDVAVLETHHRDRTLALQFRCGETVVMLWTKNAIP